MSKSKKPVKKPAKKKVPVKAKAAPKKAVKPKAKAAAKAKPKGAAKAAKAAKPAKPAKVLKGKKPAPAKPVKGAKAAKVAKAPKAPKAEPVPAKLKGKKGKAEAVVEVPVEAEIEAAEPEIQEEVVLTDAEGRRYCRVKDCDQLATVDSYCRYHYLLYWKKIQVRKKILTEGKLERYIEELTARYPDKFLDMLRKDLKSEKEFIAAIQELEIDESQGEGEFEQEEETFIDEVRGMSEPASTREEEDF